MRITYQTRNKPQTKGDAVNLGLQLMSKGIEYLEELDEVWRSDFFVMKSLMNRRVDAFQFASAEIRADRDVAFKVIEINAKMFKFVAGNLNDDAELAKLAIYKSHSGELLKYASDRLKDDKEFILDIISKKPIALEFVSKRLQDDEDVVELAIKLNLNAFKYASMRFKDDKEFVLNLMRKKAEYIENGIKRASTRNLYLIGYASERLRSDPEIAILTLKQDIFTYRCFSDKIKSMRKLALYVVKKEGILLKDVAEKFKNDKEIVMAAVKNNGDALQFASDALKADREIVMAAIKRNGRSLVYACEELRNDIDMIEMAFKSCNGVFIVDPVAQKVFERLDSSITSVNPPEREIRIEVASSIQVKLEELIRDINIRYHGLIEEVENSQVSDGAKEKKIIRLNRERERKIESLRDYFKTEEASMVKEEGVKYVAEKLQENSAFMRMRNFYGGNRIPWS